MCPVPPAESGGARRAPFDSGLRPDHSAGPVHHFVTGATGFIGGRLVRKLLERGDRVTALVRTPYRARDLSTLGARVVKGDVTDPASIRRGMAGCDTVFHVAAVYELGSDRPDRVERVNVDGTRHVLEAMRDLKLRRGVYTSSLVVHSDTGGRPVDESYRHDGDHLSHYDLTKWKAHYEVALPMIDEGLPLVVVQPGLVYGPGDHSAVRGMFEDFLRGRLPAVPGGTKYCWAHVDDIAAGHLAAMDLARSGESYHLAGPVYTFMEVFRTAARITGRRPPVFEIPPSLMRALVPVAAAAERLTGLPERFRAESLRVSAGATYISSSTRAERELGFAPRPIDIGLRDTLTDIARRISGPESTITRRFDRRSVRSHRKN